MDLLGRQSQLRLGSAFGKTIPSQPGRQKEEKGIEQIEFEDEDDSMRKMYEEECANNGVKVDMG